MFFIGALLQVVFISAPCPIPDLCPCAAYSLSHKSAGIAIPLMWYQYCTAPGLYRTCCSWQLFAIFPQVFAFRRFASSARPLMRPFFYWGSAPNPACSRRSQPIPDLLLFARFRHSSKSAASARPLMRPCLPNGRENGKISDTRSIPAEKWAYFRPNDKNSTVSPRKR